MSPRSLKPLQLVLRKRVEVKGSENQLEFAQISLMMEI